jgi:hypothetical protein
VVDNDGNLTTGGAIGLMALVMAPLLLGITLLKLFFRAPLAALLGAAFCGGIVWIGVLLFASMVGGMNPMAALFVGFLMACAGAGLCYGMMSAAWMQKFFSWECAILHAALAHGGWAGRMFYIFVQIIPGLLLAALFAAFLLAPAPARPPSDTDMILNWLVVGWLALSQIVVYRFHRTQHPVGQWATFTGRPREDLAMQVDAAE